MSFMILIHVSGIKIMRHLTTLFIRDSLSGRNPRNIDVLLKNNHLKKIPCLLFAGSWTEDRMAHGLHSYSLVISATSNAFH